MNLSSFDLFFFSTCPSLKKLKTNLQKHFELNFHLVLALILCIHRKITSIELVHKRN